MDKIKQRNVLGEPLEVCGENPITGYFRDGCCNTDTSDVGSHTVCTKVTNDFLEFSKNQGNGWLLYRAAIMARFSSKGRMP